MRRTEDTFFSGVSLMERCVIVKHKTMKTYRATKHNF